MGLLGLSKNDKKATEKDKKSADKDKKTADKDAGVKDDDWMDWSQKPDKKTKKSLSALVDLDKEPTT